MSRLQGIVSFVVEACKRHEIEHSEFIEAFDAVTAGGDPLTPEEDAEVEAAGPDFNAPTEEVSDTPDSEPIESEGSVTVDAPEEENTDEEETP